MGNSVCYIWWTQVECTMLFLVFWVKCGLAVLLNIWSTNLLWKQLKVTEITSLGLIPKKITSGIWYKSIGSYIGFHNYWLFNLAKIKVFFVFRQCLASQNGFSSSQSVSCHQCSAAPWYLFCLEYKHLVMPSHSIQIFPAATPYI